MLSLTVLTVKRHQFRYNSSTGYRLPRNFVRPPKEFGSFSFSGFTLPALVNGTRVGVLSALHHTCIPTRARFDVREGTSPDLKSSVPNPVARESGSVRGGRSALWKLENHHYQQTCARGARRVRQMARQRRPVVDLARQAQRHSVSTSPVEGRDCGHAARVLSGGAPSRARFTRARWRGWTRYAAGWA